VTGPSAERPKLHFPSEPLDRKAKWKLEVLDGSDVGAVVLSEDGVASWLWDRWSVVEKWGLERPKFFALVAGYRRELWFWMAGERTWGQCCAGLIGRIDRRIEGID